MSPTLDPAPGAPLILAGKVDGWADPDDDWRGSTVRVGGQCVVTAVANHFPYAHRPKVVTVAIADRTFGPDYLDVSGGMRGYSEYTPEEPARLFAGPHNLLDVLRRHDGRDTAVWVSGYPVNVWEPHVPVTLAHHWRRHKPGDSLRMFRSDAAALDRGGYLIRTGG